MTGGWRPSEGERALGLEFYLTRTPGIPARLKATADDFRVTEISAHPTPDPDGPFTVLRVVSRNWEQHELSRRLAAELGLPRNALGWAGTKDRRAVAERLVSYRGAPPSGPLHVPGAEVVEAYRAKDGLTLGHHFGNGFEIRLSLPHADGELQRTRTAEALRALRELGGFANFFGPQRFGEVRPITHEVGRALVQGAVDRAVDIYLTAIPPGGDAFGGEARVAYRDHRDPARALREFPPQFTFERLLLDHLARGHPAERALRSLARELRLLFIHAYQALLFNRWVSERHRRGLSLREPGLGDHVLRIARDGTVPGREAVPVEAGNLSEVRETVRRGGARLAGPLVGYETPVTQGPAGEILEGLLGAEGVDREAFRLPATPEVASRGAWRPVWVDLPPIGLDEECTPARPPDEEHGLWLTFTLPKGSYATVLVRELLKSGATAID